MNKVSITDSKIEILSASNHARSIVNKPGAIKIYSTCLSTLLLKSCFPDGKMISRGRRVLCSNFLETIFMLDQKIKPPLNYGYATCYFKPHLTLYLLPFSRALASKDKKKKL